jgi:hypothetical protein
MEEIVVCMLQVTCNLRLLQAQEVILTCSILFQDKSTLQMPGLTNPAAAAAVVVVVVLEEEDIQVGM